MELALIVLVLLLVFGASRLVDLGGSLGKGIREFRRTIKEDDDSPSDDATASLPEGEASSETPATATSGRFCSNCGTALSDQAKFCAKCGAPTPATVN
jgi:sec-independent protein translocase protein TatA